MPDVLSANLNLLEMATGTASGQWGADLNSGMIAIVDTALGTQQAVSLASTDVTLTMAQRQNLSFSLTGVLTNGVAVKLPLQTNSTTVAVGGFFLFENQCTGGFAVTVKTAVSGSSGVEVPQGVTTHLFSDGTNVLYADDAQNRTQTVSGNPNGSLAGTAGSASTRASRVIDRVTNTEYLCTTSGTASSAAWSVNLPYSFPSQGYLTPSSDATSPIITSDSIGATILYYTGLSGNLFWVYNGISMVPVLIPSNQLTLSLSASSQSSNGIYDVIGFLQNGNGTATIGFSPAWTTATAGSGNRGTGGGTPQLARVTAAGVLVNAVQQTVNSGATSYTVAANRGTYLGSVSIDSSAGQVTCHRSWGQSRKFGVWNAYNRLPIYLKAGDSTANWTYVTTSFRASNNSSANSLQVFTGLAEEIQRLEFNQKAGAAGATSIGIGYNSTTAASGLAPSAQSGVNVGTPQSFPLIARYQAPPSLGIQTVTCLELGNSQPATFYGTETNMLLSGEWRG